MAEETSTEPNGPTPNLAVLKGVVVGLGVLLVMGTILVAVKIATGLGDGDAPARPMPTAPMALADLPALPLGAGERIATIAATQNALFVHIEAGAGPGRILAIDPGQAAPEWAEVPLSKP